MSVSAFWLKWGLRFYPPLFFQRIWIIDLAYDFKFARVKINNSLLNRNYNKAIFGGTMFAATDPFYPVMFHQVFTNKGYKIMVWSKSAQIQFLKPGTSNLYFDVSLSEKTIDHAENILNTEGKFTGLFDINIYNKDGEVCVTVTSEVYIRNLNFTEITINNGPVYGK